MALENRKSAFRCLRGFSVPKWPDTPNEDKWSCSKNGDICALSDGATVSFDSGTWADILTQRFIADQNLTIDWLQIASTEYNARHNRDEMQWMMQAAFDRGSFATLAGLVILDDGVSAKVIAIGDSIVAFIDGTKLERSIPYISADEFNSSPILLSTNPIGADTEALLQGSTHEVNISSHARPVFLLLTDAIGKWLLDDPSAERVSALLEIETAEAFQILVDTERSEGRLKRDDTTMIVVGRDHDELSADH